MVLYEYSQSEGAGEHRVCGTVCGVGLTGDVQNLLQQQSKTMNGFTGSARA